MPEAFSGRLLMYSEFDLLAAAIVLALVKMDADGVRSALSGRRKVAFEWVSEGSVAMTEEGFEAELPVKVVAMSVGPDMEMIARECGVELASAILLRSWKPGCGFPCPDGPFRFVSGKPGTIFLRVPQDIGKSRAEGQSEVRETAVRLIRELLSALDAKSGVKIAREPASIPRARVSSQGMSA